MKTRRYKKRSLIKKKGKRRLRKVKTKYRKKKSRSRRVTRKKRGGLSGLGIGLISLAGVGLGVGGYFGSKHISSQRKKKREIRREIADRQQPNWMEWDDAGKGEWRKDEERPKCLIPLHIRLKYNVDEYGKSGNGKRSYTPQEKAELNHWLTNC